MEHKSDRGGAAPKTRPAPSAQPPADDDPALQGEGNYSASRRHRDAVKKFIDEGKVDAAAHEAEPASADEAEAMAAAEKAGRSHARR